MRLPTLAGLTEGTRRVFARFPEAMGVAVAAAVLAQLSVHHGSFGASHWPSWWAAAALGISTFLAVAVGTERLQPAGTGRFGRARVAGSLAALALLVAFALLWETWGESVRLDRLVQFGIASHLLVAFAPFLGRREPNAFWQYNRVLFVRCVVGALFSAVLFAGLAIALASTNPLFGLKVHERVYFDLWFAIVFVFNTGYVLAGVPEEFAALEREETYPVVLKVFAQFILIPLVAVYLSILTAYLVKVLVTGQWPKGWIGWLVSSVSAAGLLSILLVHPVRDRAENRWIGTYARWFYLALLPSIAMLFAAIGKRVGQYGFTEERYFLLALNCWIAVIAVVYTLRRAADIRWIPITLFALAMLTAFGPWGAYGVSRTDQAGRLVRLLSRHGLVDGTEARRATENLGLADRKQLSSVISYLAGTHGTDALPPALRRLVLADSALNAGPVAYRRAGRGEEVARVVMRELGIGFVAPWETSDAAIQSLQLGPVAIEIEDIAGFDRAVALSGPLPIHFAAEAGEGRLELDPRGRTMVVHLPSASWTFPLDSAIRDFETQGTPSWSGPKRPPLRLSADAAGRPARLVFRELSGTLRGDTLAGAFVQGQLYFRQGPRTVPGR